MKICNCCGQAINTGPIAVIRVDEQLLALCNRAHEEAGSNRHAQVEIAHLAWIVTGWSLADQHLLRWGMRRDDLANTANRWLLENAPSASGALPVTSADLKDLLHRAQRIAARQLREYASPSDFIEALLTDTANLRSASFLTGLRVPQSSRGDLAASSALEVLEGPQWAAARSMHSEPLQQRYTPNGSTHDGEANHARFAGFQSGLPAQDFDRRIRYEPHESTQGASDATFEPAAVSNGNEAAAAKLDRNGLRLLSARLDRQEQLLVEIQSQFVKFEQRQKRQEAFTGRIALSAEKPESHQKSLAKATQSAAVDGDFDRNYLPTRKSAAQQRWKARFKRRRWRSDSGAYDDIEKPKGIITRSRLASGGRGSPSSISSSVRDSVPLDDHEREAIDTDPDAGEDEFATSERQKRFYLSPEDEIVRAPSIGQKTAARLSSFGIHSVRDLLNCDPATLAIKSGGRFITAQRVQDWQDQARLVCTIPWLRGTHAQLLVGAGHRKLENITNADSRNVWNAIWQFSSSRDGQSILRASPPPDIERVSLWIEHAALAEPDRAA